VLVVCALALVAAAAVFLVIGLAGGDVGDLYLSMVLCLASLVVVAVSARVSRARPAPAADEAPDAIEPEGYAAAEEEPEPEPVVEPVAERQPEPEPERELVTTVSGPLVDDPTAGLSARLAKTPQEPVDTASIWAAEPAPEIEVESDDQGDVDLTEEAFPIADYDDLATEQILPLVPQLWPEEIPVVAERERATKARPAVLDALAEAIGDPGLAFPIAEYDSLDTEQITALLDRLDTADLATVQVAERAGPARVGVLVAVANQLAARK
jgi:hypothetical protein